MRHISYHLQPGSYVWGPSFLCFVYEVNSLINCSDQLTGSDWLLLLDNDHWVPLAVETRSHFTVEQFGREIGFSRAQLHRKFKGAYRSPSCRIYSHHSLKKGRAIIGSRLWHRRRNCLWGRLQRSLLLYSLLSPTVWDFAFWLYRECSARKALS